MAKLIISSSVFQSQVADLLPCNKFKKSQLTHSLIDAYNLFQYFDEVIKEPYCTPMDYLRFHSESYVKAITKDQYNKPLPYDNSEEDWAQLNEIRDLWQQSTNEDSERRYKSRSELFRAFQNIKAQRDEENESEFSFPAPKRPKVVIESTSSESVDDENIVKKFNLSGDCPIFSYLPMYLQVTTGATLSLIKNLEKSTKDNEFERVIGINWDGGRHHALRQKAEGFCYINDIVLLIQALRKKGFQKISYVDFDLHHGDGVDNAFKFSNSIQTISLHLYEGGFFPGTGGLDSNKPPNRINIPLLHGFDDDNLNLIVGKIVIPLLNQHKPDVIIIQSGGDGLMGDRFKEWQLTIRGLTRAIMDIINLYKQSHIIVLGGGGYNELVMSRFNTYLTWSIVRKYSSHITNGLIKEYIEDDSDCVIQDHEFIEMYKEEHYKFWIYDEAGSAQCKKLINFNKAETLARLERKLVPPSKHE
ncbi:histone deacetylase [Maudiozyma humilis]|uniref:histone deacetylase n=1 Tax=Maudiozyma humilis TaxID=51915 RepID=A0AAV5S159_MAUHU|nr:histone deacetylase [Kazachstania humilis]